MPGVDFDHIMVQTIGSSSLLSTSALPPMALSHRVSLSISRSPSVLVFYQGTFLTDSSTAVVDQQSAMHLHRVHPFSTESCTNYLQCLTGRATIKFHALSNPPAQGGHLIDWGRNSTWTRYWTQGRIISDRCHHNQSEIHHMNSDTAFALAQQAVLRSRSPF
jgi:hypothetical protein